VAMAAGTAKSAARRRRMLCPMCDMAMGRRRCAAYA
jgi:hypothetical protein